MEKIVFLALIFCGALSLSADEKNWISCEKTYVSLDSLFIHREGIFVCVGNDWFQTPRVSHDVNGIFVSSLVKADGWTCEYCGIWNGPWRKWCRNPYCENYGPD